MMFQQVARRIVTVQPFIAQRQQRRTILKFLTEYPSKVEELKALHKGNTSKFIWEKHPNDKYINAFGACIFISGIIQLVIGHYRLATGKGKLD